MVDGDTLDVDLAGTVERLRLIGIDTPETVKSNSLVECFSRESSAYAKQLLDGQAVSIEADPSQDTRDRYGRMEGCGELCWHVRPPGVSSLLECEPAAHADRRGGGDGVKERRIGISAL